MRARTNVRAAVAVPSPAAARSRALATSSGSPPEPVAAASSASAAQHSRRKSALVIDRNPEVARALSDCLRPELEVHVAMTPVLATSLLEELAQVDLAFVELELPGNSGEELLRGLGRWPDAIRILLAQRAGLADADLPSSRHLAHLVLCKPISMPIVCALKRATLGLLST